EGGTGLTTGAK
nr:immunoglobulin heavy chain junction region [Mus musculus]